MELRVTETELPGVLLIDVLASGDDRGFFEEVFHEGRWSAAGLPLRWPQDNRSRSGPGVLRGIHWQDDRAPMVKLVRCTRGEILDVVVDLRVGAPTFGRWLAHPLREDDHRQVLVPRGFGHAFLALGEVNEVHYRCSSLYAPSAEHRLRWNDPDLAIPWPTATPLLSAKDERGAMSLQEYLKAPSFRVEPSGP